jgi:hypothetical protein
MGIISAFFAPVTAITPAVGMVISRLPYEDTAIYYCQDVLLQLKPGLDGGQSTTYVQL